MFIRVKRAFLLIAILWPVAFAFSAEPAKGRSASPAKNFADRVAMELGLDLTVVNKAMVELTRAGYRSDNAIFFLIVAQHRTLEDLKNGKIEKEDFNEKFADRLDDMLETATKNPEWRFDVAQENNLIVSDVTRRSRAIASAVSAPETPPRQRNASSATAPFPSSDIADFMVKYFELPEEVLRQGWLELKGVSAKDGMILLILANLRAKRLIDAGALAEEKRANAFVEGVKNYHGQFHRSVQWGDLGMQENVHVNKLNAESDTILGGGRRALDARKPQPAKQEK